MMPLSKRKLPARPIPPGQEGELCLVQTREGSYWRRKRGTVKPARLNEVFKRNAISTSIVSPAAKRIYSRLSAFLNGLDTGRFIANVSARLKVGYNKTGKLDITVLKDYDLQPYNPISKLSKLHYNVIEKKGEIVLQIPISEWTVIKNNKLVTGFYFEAVLLYGDPGKDNGLRVDSEVSPLYGFEKKEELCRLSLLRPGKKGSWIVLLKISCIEGNEMAAHPRNYGMKVVWTGSDGK